MEIRVLRYFLETAREGNMTRAAQRLFISQPTMSKQLKELEKELGAKLFVRTNYNIRLTEAGMLLRERAEDIVSLVDKTEAEFKALEEINSGEIYVGAPESESMRLFAEIVCRLQREYPKIRCNIYSGNMQDVCEKLDKGLLDFAIVMNYVDPMKYNCLPMSTKDTWGVIMRQDDPLAGKESFSVSDLKKLPLIGHGLYNVVHTVKMMLKHAIIGEDFFETLGLHYFGPIDGYDIPALEKTLKRAREYDGPVLIHVLTTKGHGYDKAEEQPEHFHGVAPFYVETGDSKKASDLPSFGQVMAEELTMICERNPRIAAISAAMVGGTGLSILKARFPDRVLDVGIAEEHATTMAAGLAAGGMKPYFAVYASFFQRSYDQMIHDVCMQKWPVTFLLDRAGLSAHDGETHHGVFFLAELLPVPGMTVLAPRDLNELRQMIRFSETYEQPLAIAYGRDSILLEEYPYTSFTLGKWETLREGTDVTLLAVGSMVREALDTAALLSEKGISAGVINCSTVKPLDTDLLRAIADRPVVTMEEHVLLGGFGSTVETWYAQEEIAVRTLSFGIPDMYVQHGSRGKLLKYLGLLPEQMAQRIRVYLGTLHGVKKNDR